MSQPLVSVRFGEARPESAPMDSAERVTTASMAEATSLDDFVALRVPRTPVPPSLQDVESDVERPQGDLPPSPAAQAVAEEPRGRASLIPASRSEVTEPAGNEAFAGVSRPPIANGQSVQFVPARRTALPSRRIVLSLPLPTSGARRSIYATIVRCRQTEESFRVGFEFDAPYV